MRNYHNLEFKSTYERGQKVNWYRGYGANGYKYNVEMLIKSSRSEYHWRARPIFTSGKPMTNLPNTLYGRTLEDISKKLENLK